MNLVIVMSSYFFFCYRTALHWACKRGHAPVVMHLLQSGADVAIETHKGEHPLQLATSSEVREVFTSRLSTEAIEECTLENTNPLPIVPNYLKNPVFPYYDVEVEDDHITGGTIVPVKMNGDLEKGVPKLAVNDSRKPGVTFKIRVAEKETDFVEVELSSLTYLSLLAAICEEFELTSSDVAKIRKLPNVLVRKDKDVQRLKEGQELEIILNS